MKGLAQLTLIASLARDLTLKDANGTAIAEGTLALESTQNGRTSRNFLPFVLIGAAATSMAARTSAGSVLSVQGVPRQEKWSDEDGTKHSKLRIQGLRVEVLGGDFDTVLANGGAVVLKGGVNLAVLGGNLTADPVFRDVPGGKVVCEFSVAINEKYKDRQGADQEKVNYVQIVCWNDVAETARGLKLGDPVTIAGHAVSESWTTKEGQKRAALKFEAHALFEVTPPPAQGDRPVTSRAASPRPEAVTPKVSDQGLDDFPPEEEDLPF